MANIAKINLLLESCKECPYSCGHGHEVFCTHDLKTPGLSVGNGEEIPDFCPFVLKRLEAVVETMDSATVAAIPRKYIQQVMRKQQDDPDPKFGADHGWGHIERVYEYGARFLEDLISFNLNTPNSVQKQKLMLAIAARMHDIGLADSPRSHAIHSAELTKKYFEMKKIDIDIDDAHDIVHAIYNHSKGDETWNLLDAALILGDKLDVTKERIVRTTDRVTNELTKVEEVSFTLIGSQGVAKRAELSYTTDESFDVEALHDWPKSVTIPRRLTLDFLKLSQFTFLVNGHEVDVSKF